MTIAPDCSPPHAEGLAQEAQDSLGRQNAVSARLGEPDEYAAMVEHIIENTMLNGETIRLDGAIRMQPASGKNYSAPSACRAWLPRVRAHKKGVPSAVEYASIPTARENPPFNIPRRAVSTIAMLTRACLR